MSDTFDEALTRAEQARDALQAQFDKVSIRRATAAPGIATAEIAEMDRLAPMLEAAKAEVDMVVHGTGFLVSGVRVHPAEIKILTGNGAPGAERLKQAVLIAQEQTADESETPVTLKPETAHEALLRQEIKRLHEALGVDWGEDPFDPADKKS